MQYVTLVLHYLYLALIWLAAMAKEYPTIAAPVIGALVTLFLKPRSPEAYTRMAARYPTWLWSRIAAMLQLIGALFPDPQKAAKVIVKVITGKSEPPPAP